MGGFKVNGWGNIYHTNANQKKAGVAIIISDQLDIIARKIIRNKEQHYIMIQRVSPTRRHNNLKCVCTK